MLKMVIIFQKATKKSSAAYCMCKENILSIVQKKMKKLALQIF